ncbi:MAG: ABC transporter substrate-binding protein [Limnochordia bacterium]|jgi:multiple sugar transport system substrate-binding protein
MLAKKSSRLMILVLAVALCLSLFGAAASAEKVHLKYTYWGSPLEKTAQEEMLKDFMEAYPHIEVQPIYIPSDYVTKITAMLAAGDPPDVGQLGEGQVLAWAEEGVVMDITPFMERDPEVSFDSRLPMTWYMYDGGKKTVGTNLAAEIMMMFYNKDIFDEAGVPYPSANADEWTWDDFVETAIALTKDRNGRRPGEAGFDPNNIDTYGVAFGTWWAPILPFVWSNGGDWFDDEGRETLINQPESVEALQKLHDLIYKYHVAPTPTQMQTFPAFNILLQTRKVAMVVDGQWALLDLAKSGFNLGVAPIPKLKEPVCLELGAPNVIFSGTKHPQEAWLLYKWSTSSSKVMPLIQAGLWMPLGMEYYTEPEKINEWLTEGVHPPEYKEAVIDYVLDYGRRAPSYYMRNWEEITSAISQGLSNFWLGKEDAQTAADRVAETVKPLLQGRFDR